MKQLCLVTGANGHLGNNLVRALLDKGHSVRAGIRNFDYKDALKDLDCEIVYTELLDQQSLEKAAHDVDVVYQVGAVFKHWAVDPEKEIIQVNNEGTKNIIRAAAAKGVKKVIYVSSIAALDRTTQPIAATSWNRDFKDNPYFQSKTESEKIALDFAKALDVSLVSILPSAMIGPNCFMKLSPTMQLLYGIINNKMLVDPNFYNNFVDVRDVAAVMIAAAEKGKDGERYIIANEHSLSTTQIFEMANKLYPEIKIPQRIAKEQLLFIASQMEAESKKTGNPPALLTSNVELYFGADLQFDISKAKTDLDYLPETPETALTESIRYLKENW